MDESLRQATLGASNIQTPGSPLGSFPELSQLYQSSFQLPQSSGGVSALAGQAQESVRQQEAKQKAKPQRVKKADGGFEFYDSSGKPITAEEYASATGKRAIEVLADSENPIDIGYLEDYNNLQEYMQAKLNSKTNSKLRTKAENIEKQVKEAFGKDIASMNPQQLIEQFKRAYPTIYGRKNAGVGAGQVFIPQADSGGSNSKAADLFAQYGIQVEQ